MKQLEIKLQERLLIWGYEDEYEFRKDDEGMYFWNRATGAVVEITKEYELICKGDELTEEVAKGLVHQSVYSGHFGNYGKGYPLYKTALESFISAIESNGYFWGENPLGPEPKDIPDLGEFTVMMRKKHQEWKKAESRTFNPSRTLIFKIS